MSIFQRDKALNARDAKAEEVARTEVEAPSAAVALGLEAVATARGWKWVGQCPACATDGKDRTGNHLAVFENGAFDCVVNQGERGGQHRSMMAKLCPPLRGNGKHTGEVYVAPDLTAEREALKTMAAVLFEAICEELRGDISSLGKSGNIDSDPRWQFAAYCELFYPTDLVWVGHLYDAPPIHFQKNKETGEREVLDTKPHRQFPRHLFEAGDLASREMMFKRAMAERLDLSRGIAWKAGSQSRISENAAARRFTCVEHDDVSKADQIALLNYCRDVLRWDLRMVIDTTGKSYHGLFDVSGISVETLAAQTATLENMGVDPAALRNSATRCPGLIRQPHPNKTNKPHGDMQRVLWIA